MRVLIAITSTKFDQCNIIIKIYSTFVDYYCKPTDDILVSILA